MSGSSDLPAILYIVSRFPKITETFVVNEWWQLRRHFRMELATLLITRERVAHPKAQAILEAVQSAPIVAPSTAWANAAMAVRRPATYAQTATAVFRGAGTSGARELAEAAVVFWKAVALARRAQRLQMSHVHAHFVNHPATAALVIKRLTGIPFSVTAHANDLFVRPALLSEKVREAAFLVTVSEFNRNHLTEAVNANTPVEIVHCGVDLAEFPYRDPQVFDRVLCVARLEPTKGHEDLLAAVAELAAELPRLTVDLVGDGPERRRLGRLVRELAIADRVRFHGALSAPQVRLLLNRAGLFVLAARRHPSGRMDGIPVALMEAMAVGIPVASTRLSGIPELVIDGKTGLLVEPEDHRALAVAIRRLASDRTLARRLARRAREHVAANFDIEVGAHRLAELFNSSSAQNFRAHSLD